MFYLPGAGIVWDINRPCILYICFMVVLRKAINDYVQYLKLLSFLAVAQLFWLNWQPAKEKIWLLNREITWPFSLPTKPV